MDRYFWGTFIGTIPGIFLFGISPFNKVSKINQILDMDTERNLTFKGDIIEMYNAGSEDKPYIS